MAEWDQSQRIHYMDAEQRHRYTRYPREDSTYQEWCEVVMDMPHEFWGYCKGQAGGSAQAFILGLIAEHRAEEAMKEPEPSAV